jgi:6,7-dimethyl-8-ribityllumazine synthase
MAINLIEGNVLNESNVRIGIVCSRFNEFIVGKLLDGALDGLRRHGVPDESVTCAWVPGAFEIPLVAQRMAESGNYDAVIALGCVIRGATSHYELVCNEVTKGVAQTSLKTGVPVMFGVITTENLEQAVDRAGAKVGNKGYECAVGALELVNVLRAV